jgi:dienelactone hydrolase
MRFFLAFLLFLTGFAHAQKKSDLIIDTKKIKVDGLLWDLEKLSKAPKVEWLDRKSKVHALLYEGVEYEGKATQVFAYYSNPDLLAGKVGGTTKFPGIVLIHGGGGKAFKEWVEKWAAEGYAVIAMDLSGNGPDDQKIARPGLDQSNFNKFEKIEQANIKDVWSYHAVAAGILAHSLLLNLPEVNSAKTCVTGISWGGYLTCIVAALDNRFKAAVPVYGCGFYDESDVFKVPLERLTAAGRQNWMRHFDPSVYLSSASPQFCFINGNKDKHYNVAPYSKTYQLVPVAQRTVLILPDMKHSHPWGWEPHEIRYFFESVLNDKRPLTRVHSINEGPAELSARYEGSVSLWTAEFYYSNDLVSDNESRVWHKQKVTIDANRKTISTSVPTGGYKYGFFALRDHRNLAASSEFLFK